MELLQFRYFLAVAKYEHMTKAANVLHVAQPSLSQCIGRLEKELGVSLFDRKGRQIILNENGKMLQKKLRPIMAAIDGIPKDFEQAELDKNTPIKLNISAGSNILTEILIQYQELHPEVKFHLMQGVIEEEWDIQVFTLPGGAAKKGDDAIFEEEIFLAAPLSSKFAGRDSVDLAELSEERFVSLAGSRQLRAICDGLCDSVGFTPDIVFESDSPYMVRNLIGAGIGVSFWPAYSWGEFTSDKAVLIPIRRPICRRKLVVRLNRKAAYSPKCKDFYQYILQHMQSIMRMNT